MKMLHRGEKGFTLIELLVVIAILGVIAAVVALNVAGFFGEGTLQAANTELHQAQTAIVSAMADVESNNITVAGVWAGEPGVVVAHGANNSSADASEFCYGPFRAGYSVSDNVTLGIGAIYYGDPNIAGGWGPSISWNNTYMNWQST
jgi:prepilin-type N-terminal cleavage/methylation domain-containing protein